MYMKVTRTFNAKRKQERGPLFLLQFFNVHIMNVNYA